MEKRYYIIKVDNYGKAKLSGYIKRVGYYSQSICSDIYGAKMYKTIDCVEKDAGKLIIRCPDIKVSILTIKIVVEDDRVY